MIPEMEEMMENQRKAYESWKEWMEIQAKILGKWFELGTFAPETSQKPWQAWMEESNKWIRQNILGKIPDNMKPHYRNFTSLYDEMARYWEPIQRMIRFGTFSRENVDQFFSAETYRDIAGLFLGFKPVENTGAYLDEVNAVFDDYIERLQKATPGSNEFANSWIRSFQDWGLRTGLPGLQAVAGISDLINRGLNSFYHLAGPTEELAMAKELKDIQFAYTSFLLKSYQMQRLLFDAGQQALPDTLKSFTLEFKKSGQMPDYPGFFGAFANNLEKSLLKVLESDEFSALQAEVAKLGVTVKSKLDKFAELAFADFPFLMKSFSDEVAEENKSLRRKIRDLENRLDALESTPGGKKTTRRTGNG